MKNETGLIPVGRAVLVQPVDKAVKSDIIEIPDSVEQRAMLLEMEATVVALGPHCWPDEPARAQPGDRVMLAKLSGTFVKSPRNGRTYRVVNDRDIFVKLEQ